MKKKQQEAGDRMKIISEKNLSPKEQHYTRENLYSHINLTVKQMDYIIAGLAVFLVLVIVIGILIK